jgi:hypothetical protein
VARAVKRPRYCFFQGTAPRTSSQTATPGATGFKAGSTLGPQNQSLRHLIYCDLIDNAIDGPASISVCFGSISPKPSSDMTFGSLTFTAFFFKISNSSD